jgi:type I restriction enzyme S subunit
MKMWQGSLGISDYDGIVSPAYIVCNLFIKANLRYLHFLLRSPLFKTFYNQVSYGIRVGQWDMHYDDFKSLCLYFPPRPEQDQIVRYLSWKISMINKYINTKKKQIELLKEQKQAVVNETVTRGGKEKQARRLKTLVKEVTNKASPKNCFYIGMENIISGKAEYVETAITVEGDCKQFLVGDVLFGKLRPYLAKVYLPEREGVCSGEFLVLRGFSGYLPYLKYVLLSYNFVMTVNASTYGAKMPRANWDFIGNCEILLPSISEQQSKAEYLDNQCAKIDRLIGKLNDEIALFAEYRTRLLSDVVTGKVNVQSIKVSEFENIECQNNHDSDEEAE